MEINWYPGHMAKAKRELQEQLKKVDVVVEVLDARIPHSSRNPDLGRMCAHKKRLMVLGKSDLADPEMTKAWEEQIRTRYPDAAVYRRVMMKPACRFMIPEDTKLPEGYLLADMDEAAFAQHPFSHGENYHSWPAFKAEGSGAVVY